MKKLVTFILVIFSINCWSYDGLPKEQVSSFFTDYEKGEYQKALQKLHEDNPMHVNQPQQLLLLQQQVSTTIQLYGKVIGNENVQYEELSPSLIRVVQIAKHEIHPVVWEFYFYKPKDKWILSQSLFVDQFQVIGSKK